MQGQRCIASFDPIIKDLVIFCVILGLLLFVLFVGKVILELIVWAKLAKSVGTRTWLGHIPDVSLFSEQVIQSIIN